LKNDRFLVLENDRILVLENYRFLVLENDRPPLLESVHVYVSMTKGFINFAWFQNLSKHNVSARR
jgi:hypothetical protein